jgi:nucleoside-diphosphate-sugar epimerase
VVVNLAYGAAAGHDENLALAQAVADVCAGSRAERLVHISTAMVVGRCGDRWVTEETPCRPVSPYERTKFAVETRLRRRAADACPLVILRPTAVFGRGGANLRKLSHDLVTRPWFENDLRSALYGERAMNLVPVETVVAAIGFAAASDRAITDGLYLVAADEAPDNNFHHVERVLRRALGVSASRVPALRLPPGTLPLVLRAAGRVSLDPRARFSSARLHGAGFTPPIAFADALDRYAAQARTAAAPAAGPRT